MKHVSKREGDYFLGLSETEERGNTFVQSACNYLMAEVT